MDGGTASVNALERHIAETGANASVLMDWLQGHGIISDNCVLPRDVYSGDAEEAVRRIKEAFGKAAPTDRPGGND